MGYAKLVKLFEERKAQIMKIFHEEPVQLTKKHQMYGAMKEIDLFLEVLRYQEEQEVPKSSKGLKGFGKIKRLFFQKLIEK